MTIKRMRLIKVLGGVLCFVLWTAVHASAQFGGGGGTAGSSVQTRQYPPNGNVGPATFSINPTTKQITFIADEKTAQTIRELVRNLDRPVPQVLIKVVFLEVTYNNASDIGIEGSITRKVERSGESPLTGIFSNMFGLGAAGGLPVPPGAALYTILGNDFQATIRAISQAGKTEVLSRPSILTRNNQQATISLGQQVPLISATRFDTLGNQINTVSYQSVGIILQVTPFITSDGMVQMIVAPQISELADKSQWVPISSGPSGSVAAPVINSRSADTVVVVPNGQTVVIGGLMENSKASTESKVPLLGDIPLIGNLFKRTTKNYTKTELIIFLTPHVVADPTQLAALSASERANSQLAPKAFSEKELDRFLDTVPVKGQASPGAAATNNANNVRSPSPRNTR
jgi:general secretion pathway protein D